jgi:hypothetical protein
MMRDRIMTSLVGARPARISRGLSALQQAGCEPEFARNLPLVTCRRAILVYARRAD